MNGPEHYREAERLLGVAQAALTAHGDVEADADSTAGVALIYSAAQVHATLAHAAATVETGYAVARDDWIEAVA